MARILIAEDDEITRFVLRTMMEKWGYHYLLSPNGQHAWETLLTDKNIDFLITDVMMPEMNGKELVQLIRKNDELKQMPIIIISAFVGPKEIGKLLDLGATFFLPKPIDFKDLKDGITKCLKKCERQKMNKIYSYYYRTNQ